MTPIADLKQRQAVELAEPTVIAVAGIETVGLPRRTGRQKNEFARASVSTSGAPGPPGTVDTPCAYWLALGMGSRVEVIQRVPAAGVCRETAFSLLRWVTIASAIAACGEVESSALEAQPLGLPKT